MERVSDERRALSNGILAATDGSSNAQRALVWAAGLAELAEARLTVVGVDSVHQAEVTPEFYDERAHELRSHIDDRIRDAGIGAVDVVPVFCLGRPADEIERVALEMSADLIVVGARGSGGFTRLGLGSTTHQLAHATRVPLVAVHGESTVGVGTRLVVGVDGSPGSARALKWAASLAPMLATVPLAVLVHDPTADSYPHPGASTWKYHGQQDAERVAAEVGSDSGVGIEVRIASGNAVEELARIADELAPSMVVVGTRSGGFSPHRILGRVPMELLHHCAQPVVLVPHARADGDFR